MVILRFAFFFFSQERQKQLESLGISLQSSGIRVVDDKCFLVNLNADPALNELLVYYLKVRHKRSPDRPGLPCRVLQQLHLFFPSCVQEHTRVGSANSQDIQLCGMAIQAQHCIIDVAESNRVVLSPLHNARCVQLSNSGKGGKGSPQDLQNLILRFSGFSSCQDTRQWYRSHQPGPASSRRPNLVGEQPLF